MTIKEVCEKYDITADTLRYYCAELGQRRGSLVRVALESGSSAFFANGRRKCYS